MGVKTGIYYFPWYNEQRWKEAPFKYTPLLGRYDSSDPAIIAWQLDLIQYCGIDYVIFELVPEGDWAFATVERGIDGAIAYLRRKKMEWSFLLDTKNCPSNTVMEQRSEIAGIERMYRYVLKRGWADGLVRGPSGKPLLLVFAPVPEDALIIGEEFAGDIEFRMPIFLPDRQWDTRTAPAPLGRGSRRADAPRRPARGARLRQLLGCLGILRICAELRRLLVDHSRLRRLAAEASSAAGADSEQARG